MADSGYNILFLGKENISQPSLLVGMGDFYLSQKSNFVTKICISPLYITILTALQMNTGLFSTLR
jgi:hypothetical protein